MILCHSSPTYLQEKVDDMSHETISSVEYGKSITERRAAEDLRSIAHVKRFLELLTGDSTFREKIKANPASANNLAKKKGIDIDLGKFSGKFQPDGPLSEKCHDLKEYPLAVLWREWIQDWRTFVKLIREDGYSHTADPRFNGWRKRQVERVNIEFGTSRADSITHPIFSFELSKGCSVGCWFCALGAESFKGHYERTPKNVLLWRNILSTAVNLFGSAAQASACYWATEPFDNPNYLDFIQDYCEIVGLVPQTTSAAPTRDLVWTRRLMEMHKLYPSVPSRFSIVNSRILRDLHANFSPEELLCYELIMQLKGSSYGKARAGKTLKKVKSENTTHKGLHVDEGSSSIACLSGYIVNMMDGTIQLVSPSLANERWPLGYRIHASGTFTNAQDFGDFIERSISEHMPAGLPPDQAVAYRDGLVYQPRENGFLLSSDFAAQSFTGFGFVSKLGDMVAEGKYKPAQIIGDLVDDGADIFGVRGTVEDLFNKGFLEDLPI